MSRRPIVTASARVEQQTELAVPGPQTNWLSIHRIGRMNFWLRGSKFAVDDAQEAGIIL